MDLFKSQVPDTLRMVYTKMLKKSESERVKLYMNFKIFYEGDFLNIEPLLIEIIRRIKMFKKEKIDNKSFLISHVDMIKKAVKRHTAGILDKAPKITLKDSKGKTLKEENKYFNELLNQIKLYKKTKDTVRRSDFVNLAGIFVVWRDGKIKLDVVTPESMRVDTKNDFNDIDVLWLQRVRRKPDGTDEMYWSVWSEKEHLLILADGKKEYLKDNPNGINPYKVIPFAFIKKEEGSDFWGEPNWSLYLNQITQDLQFTGHDYATIFQSNPFYLATNLNLGEEYEIDPTKFVYVTHKDKEKTPPDIKAIKAEYEGEKMLENIQKRNEMVLSSESLPAATASTDVPAQSGTAKTIDEIETQESRDDFRLSVYDFLLDLLNIIRIVNNDPPPGIKTTIIPEDAMIDIQLSTDKPYETSTDKKTRREMEKANYIKDEVDFVMEDLELSEEDAIEHITVRKERMKKLFGETDPLNDPENNNPNDKKPNDNTDTEEK